MTAADFAKRGNRPDAVELLSGTARRKTSDGKW